MTPQSRVIGLFVLSLGAAPSIEADDLLTPIQVAAACAPLAAATATASQPSEPLRIIGVQDTVPRTLMSARDLLIIDGVAARGVQLDQRFYIRRPANAGVRHATGPRGTSTSGWARVVAVNETTTIALVEFAYDGILAGDVLQPYADPVLPPDADRTDTTGEPDFSAAGAVLFGEGERTTGGPGDFLVADIGERSGASPGTRLAIYRDLRVAGLPLAGIGEAVVVSVDPNYSLIRVTRARDAVAAGDLLVPRRRP